MMQKLKGTGIVWLTFLIILDSVSAISNCEFNVENTVGIISCTNVRNKTDFFSEINRIKEDFDLTSIRTFQLTVNESNLETLNSEILKPFDENVIQKITQISLIQCVISDIDDDFFTYFQSLKQVDLSGSIQLSRYEFLRNLGNVEVLVINDNNLAALEKKNGFGVIFSNNFTTVKLSNCSLSSFDVSLDSPVKVTLLDLSHNVLTSFNDKDIKNLSIHTLDLSYNNIHNLTLLNKYKILSLRGNQNLTRITKKITLDKLDLSEQRNSSKMIDLLQQFYVKLELNLSEVDWFDKIDFKTLLRQGASLDLSKGHGVNFSAISEDSFKNFSFGYLNLEYNNISLLKIGDFDQSTFEVLDLGNNNMAGINGTGSNVQVDTLILSYNKLNEQQVQIMCKNVNSIQTLKLDNNSISAITNTTLSDCKTLSILDLSNNQIANITKNSFDNVPLISLKITAKSGAIFSNITNRYLTNLNIVGSELELGPNAFAGLPSLEELNFNGSFIASVDTNTLKGLRNLKYIDAKTLLLNAPEIPDGIFSDLSELLLLDLSGVKIENIRAQLGGLYNLIKLDVSSCNITHIEPTGFADLHSVVEIILRDNELTSLEFGMFNNLDKLEVLDLAKNRLYNFRDGIFSNLKSLRMLDLSNNQISNLPYEIILPLRGLSILNLENNKLETNFKYEVFESLPSISYVAIQGNFWICDDLISIIQFFESRNISYAPLNGSTDNTDLNINGISCH